MTTEQPRIIPIETAACLNYNQINVIQRVTEVQYSAGHCSSGEANNNHSDVQDSEDGNDPNRKPSYVGLSCAVSGYSNFIRYTSPSRKNSPPQTFRVESGPQVLDNSSMKNLPPVRGQQQSSIDATDLSTYYPASHTRKIVQTTGGMASVETVTKFYNNNNINNGSMIRETSPGSDTSSVGSGGSLSSGGNGTHHQGSTTLVQKQIERLYGGKMSQMRLTSPEPKSDDSGSAGYSPESGSNNDSGSESLFKNSPLELKTLKVPAVFRLLRPEFREQLKSNSCQVKIPTDFSSTPTSSRTNRSARNSVERVIPIEVLENKQTKNGKSPNNFSPEKIVPTVQEGGDLSSLTKQWSPTNGNDATPISNDTTPTSNNKVIKTTERIIPVVCETKPFQGRKLESTPEKTVEKPALQPKPTSPTRTPRSPTSESITLTSIPPLSTNSNITSSALVSSLQKVVSAKASTNKNEAKHDSTEEVASKELNAVKPEPVVEVQAEQSFPQPEDLEEDEELMEDEEGYPPCGGQGVRERTLLCPIQEEDTESTTSGSSVSVANNGTKRSTVINNNVNTTVSLNPTTTDDNTEDIQEEIHDGHYFIKILENEIFKFEEQICDFEEDLSNEANDFSDEEIHAEVLTAIGKARLLMSQKLAQFRGLCEKNINTKVEDDPYVPTNEDLAGFWDMVYIQVVHIHTLFAELTTIRTNGWKRPEVKKSISAPKKETSTKAKPKAKTGNNKKAGSGAPKSEAAKARDEARRKMLEERKRQMKLKQQQQCDQQKDNEEIFIQF